MTMGNSYECFYSARSTEAASLVVEDINVGWQSLPQKLHLWVVSGLLEFLRSFQHARLSAAAVNGFSSSVLRCWFEGRAYTAVSCAVTSKALSGQIIDVDRPHASRAATHLDIAGGGGRWFSYPLPDHRRTCLLGYDQPPYCRYDPTIAIYGVWAKCVCMSSISDPGGPMVRWQSVSA